MGVNSNQVGTKTLDLLAQYDNHILERDRSIDYIDRQDSNSDKPSYDDLFKENVKLKLQVHEYETEIQSLKQVIEMFSRHNGNKRLDLVLEQIQSNSKDSEATKKVLELPPRSADRKNNIKDLNLPLLQHSPQHSEDSIGVPKINLQEPLLSKNETPISSQSESIKTDDEHVVNSTNPFLASKSISSSSIQSSLPQQHLASPATSVTYTTSRITIKSPHKSICSPVQERISSPQNSNRVTSVINNQIRSPLKKNYEDREIDFNASPNPIEPNGKFSISKNSNPLPHDHDSESLDLNESPVRYVNNNSEFSNNKLEFSPAAKARLNNFTELLESSFGETESLVADNTNENTNNTDLDVTDRSYSSGLVHPAAKQLSASSSSSPSLNRLGSPILLDRKNNGSIKTKHSAALSSHHEVVSENANNSYIKEVRTAESSTLINSPSGPDSISSAPIIHDNNTPDVKTNNLGATNTGTTKSNAPSVISEIPLFVQPEDFGTITIDLLSTLYQEMDMDSEDYLILLSVLDRSSEREMFKFSKSLPKIRELDVYLKSHVSSLSLPTLPDRSLFQSIIPSKVALRREQLNAYFQSIFSIPEFPPNVSLKIAQFLSTDTVINPMLLDDTVKEGTLMIRRPKKALGNQPSWKLRRASLNGDTLRLSDRDQVTEVIKLRQCSIEIIPNLPDDKFGTKNGFLINEHKKSGLSSNSKYYACTESAKERELWISAINEFTDVQNNDSHAHLSNTSGSNYRKGVSGTHNDTNRLIPKGSSTMNSIDENFDLLSNPHEQKASLSVSTQASRTSSRQPSTTSSPAQATDQSDVIDEREARRLKMRSIFPFKKLNLNSMTSSAPATSLQLQNNNDSSSTVDFEAVTVIPQDSSSTPTDDKVRYFTATSPSSYQPSGKGVFGSNLDACLKLSSHIYQNNYELPSVVYRCLEYLYKNHGLREEGVFRLSGSSTMIKTLQERFDKEYDVDLCAYENDPDNAYLGVNTVTGLLKLYLRSLPHLIFGDEQYLLFKRIVDENHSNPQKLALGFRGLVEANEIPKANMALMYSLFELLSRVADNNKYNKMNLRNLCIVFSPTLNIPIVMLQPFIVDFKCIFKGQEPTPDEQREQFDIHIPQL